MKSGERTTRNSCIAPPHAATPSFRRGGGTGDPTEIAILRAASEHGIARPEIERANRRVVTNPFSSERRRMSVLRSDGKLYLKGAAETVFERCVSGLDGAREATLQMGGRALRVLAVAAGRGPDEHQLHLIGLIGLADPPRSEAIEAVRAAREAGIKTVMITGDHPSTAVAIAREMGIIQNEMELPDAVHARATAEQKYQIVGDWKRRGAIVTMTGDGVNDAPALREAHIGVAMGRTGTEVTREASAMILVDDNFASLVAAVREGRGIYDNIQKALIYLLTGNAAELFVMLGAALAALPNPLVPLQLLWINLVTDGLPALALVMDPASLDVLKRPPRRPDAPMLPRRKWLRIVTIGAMESAVALGAFAWALESRRLCEARNLAFSVLVFAELFRALSARSETAIFWTAGAFSNLALVGVIVISVSIQIAIHHLPFTQSLFSIGAMSAGDCALSVALGLIPVTLIELEKLAARGKQK